jgi:hypothetical protein
MEGAIIFNAITEKLAQNLDLLAGQEVAGQGFKDLYQELDGLGPYGVTLVIDIFSKGFDNLYEAGLLVLQT